MEELEAELASPGDFGVARNMGWPPRTLAYARGSVFLDDPVPAVTRPPRNGPTMRNFMPDQSEGGIAAFASQASSSVAAIIRVGMILWISMIAQGGGRDIIQTGC